VAIRIRKCGNQDKKMWQSGYGNVAIRIWKCDNQDMEMWQSGYKNVAIRIWKYGNRVREINPLPSFLYISTLWGGSIYMSNYQIS
jgi:hypothetical protein